MSSMPEGHRQNGNIVLVDETSQSLKLKRSSRKRMTIDLQWALDNLFQENIWKALAQIYQQDGYLTASANDINYPKMILIILLFVPLPIILMIVLGFQLLFILQLV